MHHYDLRIVAVFVLFIGVCVASGFKWYCVKDLSSGGTICQQLDVSSHHLVSVDCGVIVSDSFTSSKPPNMAVFFFDPISINNASFELLQTVQGVGPKLAHKIITYRTEEGPFVGVESIQKITGVGEKRAQYLATQFSFN